MTLATPPEAAIPAPPPASADKFAGPDAPRVLHFGFCHRNRSFRATLSRGDSQAHLAVHGYLGDLPFTAQSAATRTEILRMIRARRPQGRLEVAAAQQIVFHGQCDLRPPLTGIDVIAAVVQVLIEADRTIEPILICLEKAQAYFAAGSVKI